ncbi:MULTISPECIES: DdrH [Deinococcus]|uniref:DdrH n=1 Tax=Deinococcus rufus TaxID=2136097 RepID=A0ABV7Z9A3_9DEIO|nr:DdrH [Deinococcus sp. AB2017081]WQE96254.1 DdrH [Deinococcus sp. AB2017081]
MTNPATSNPYAEWFERLRAEYGEQLGQMPLPDGLPEHLRVLMHSGDEEAILFMLKLAWQFGAQVGYAAGARQSEEQISVMRPSRGVQA